MNVNQLLGLAITRNASDLHLISGSPPTIRLSGELVPLLGFPDLDNTTIETLVFPILSTHQKEIFNDNWELDFGIDFESVGRFRVNLYRERNTMAASFRFIPKKIRRLEELGLPTVISRLTELKQGLVLVTGPTGHGKSTTLAGFVEQINLTRNNHIITIEDPIEFIYPKGKSLISQRELNSDTKSWDNALKSALREDPDVVLVGEMRDLETIAAALTIAETGHLVFATLHTNSAAQSIDRVIDVFPSGQQSQIRSQLSFVMEAIISQRLIPTINPGRVLACEILFGNPAARAIIREGKTHLIDNLIQTSAETGMVSLESSLVSLIRQGVISIEVAQSYSLRPDVLSKMLEV